jgi:hypothetical protein
MSNTNKQQTSRLWIDRQGKIFLLDYEKTEVKMQPLAKALFLLFLKHPQGISYYDLTNYTNDLKCFYRMVTNLSSLDTIEDNITRLINRQDNSLYEKVSRIKEAFKKCLPKSVAKEYYLTGSKQDSKSIKLDRNLVIWEK